MSVDPNKFGITSSLVEAVKEALHPNQKKLDVAEPKGKLTGADFKKLRGEDKDKEQAVANEQTAGDYSKINYKHKMMKNNGIKEGPEEKDVTNPKQGSSVDPKQRSIGEADENPVAKQIAAKKDAMKKQIQQKIAQKQMQVMQSKAQKRLSNIHASNDKCTCGTTSESKMNCEVHGGKHNEKKGGKEPIEMNPPLKEAGELPKKVVSKGHEIAKSLIKKRADVREPYAVGMATAKKSAGIKEEVVGEGTESLADIHKKIDWHQQAMGNAQYRGPQNTFHRKKLQALLAKKKEMEKGVKEGTMSDAEKKELVGEAVNAKKVAADHDAGHSTDVIVQKHLNKKGDNKDEILKAIRAHAWNKRMNKKD